jgi:hypothetical protein
VVVARRDSGACFGHQLGEGRLDVASAEAAAGIARAVEASERVSEFLVHQTTQRWGGVEKDPFRS